MNRTRDITDMNEILNALAKFCPNIELFAILVKLQYINNKDNKNKRTYFMKNNWSFLKIVLLITQKKPNFILAKEAAKQSSELW